MTFAAIEERWAALVLASFAPPLVRGDAQGLAPQSGEVDFRGSLRRFCRALSWRPFWGLRIALWMVAASPLWLWRRFRRFSALEPEERAELLAALLRHPRPVVRGLTKLLKLQAALAIFAIPGVRARSGYDRPLDIRRLRPRSLPLVVDEVA